MLDLLYCIDMAFRGIHDADPSDTSVLSLQDRHRSHLVDTEQVRNLLIMHWVFSSCNMYFINNHIQICMFRWLQLQEILRPRQQMRAFMSMWRMDIRIQPYLIRSGFYGIFRLGHIVIDWPLITSLVERWRPETHTFHVPVGEMTITLQDVAILLGLRIHGPAVTGTCAFDVAALCAELLGVIPPADAVRGVTISLRWLCLHLSTPPPDANDGTLERCVRGFILALIGSFLFADKKGVMVPICYLPLLRDLTHTATYSWGGAVLAHTYRELCRASLDRSRGISGCITLIQVCNNWVYSACSVLMNWDAYANITHHSTC